MMVAVVAVVMALRGNWNVRWESLRVGPKIYLPPCSREPLAYSVGASFIYTCEG